MKYTKVDARVPKGPNEGKLFAVGSTHDSLYFVNGGRRTLQTGIEIDIPQGVTVALRGIYEQRVSGLTLVERDIHGPWKGPLDVVIWNQSPATVQLEPYSPIAEIHAYSTPTVKQWQDTAEPVDDPAAPAAPAAGSAESVSEQPPPKPTAPRRGVRHDTAAAPDAADVQ